MRYPLLIQITPEMPNLEAYMKSFWAYGIYGWITAVPDGTVFEHIATADNGWYAVKVGSQVGWVSGKYSEITTE